MNRACWWKKTQIEKKTNNNINFTSFKKWIWIDVDESWCYATSTTSESNTDSNSSTSRAIYGPEISHLWRAWSFSLKLMAPTTPLILLFICSWLWSRPILENFRLVFWTANFPFASSLYSVGWLRFTALISVMWTGNHLAYLVIKTEHPWAYCGYSLNIAQSFLTVLPSPVAAVEALGELSGSKTETWDAPTFVTLPIHPTSTHQHYMCSHSADRPLSFSCTIHKQ